MTTCKLPVDNYFPWIFGSYANIADTKAYTNCVVNSQVITGPKGTSGVDGVDGAKGAKGDKGDPGDDVPSYIPKHPYEARNFCTIGESWTDPVTGQETKAREIHNPFGTYISNAGGFAANKTAGLLQCQKLCDDRDDCKSFTYRGDIKGPHICTTFSSAPLDERNNGAGFGKPNVPAGGPYTSASCNTYFEYEKMPVASASTTGTDSTAVTDSAIPTSPP